MLLAGGLIGSALGVQIFTALRTLGQFELVVSLLYVVLLGTIGGLMLHGEPARRCAAATTRTPC